MSSPPKAKMLSTSICWDFGTKCPEVLAKKGGARLEENQGYVIRQSVLFDNGRGFVLAESQTSLDPEKMSQNKSSPKSDFPNEVHSI